VANIDLDSADIMQLMIDALTDGGLSEMITDETGSDLSEATEQAFSEVILALDSGGTSNSYALKAREHLAQAAEQIAKLISSVEVSDEEAGG